MKLLSRFGIWTFKCLVAWRGSLKPVAAHAFQRAIAAGKRRHCSVINILRYDYEHEKTVGGTSCEIIWEENGMAKYKSMNSLNDITQKTDADLSSTLNFIMCTNRRYVYHYCRHPEPDAGYLEPERCARAPVTSHEICRYMEPEPKDVPLVKVEGQIWCPECCLGELLDVKALAGTAIHFLNPDIERLSYKAKYEAFEGLLAHWEKEGRLDTHRLLIMRATKHTYLRNWEQAIED